MRRLSGLLLALALACAPATPQTGVRTPAVGTLRWPARLPEIGVRDPWVVVDRATGTYHLFVTNDPALSGVPAVGTMMYTSRDLVRWQRPRLVFRLPAGLWAKAGNWAPEVHRWQGRWYLFGTMHDEAAALPPGATGRPNYRRGTILAVADRLAGPFRVVRGGEPVAPAGLMTLDGTLHVDTAGRPWMVYAHEWLQLGDGTIEALPLDAALAAAGAPRTLFRGSAFPGRAPPPQPDGTMARVTDGPELFRTRTGTLLMLWSSFDERGYGEALARSRSGTVAGPWEQLGPLLTGGSGHGMLFHDLAGRWVMIVHHPNRDARAHLYLVRDEGDRIAIERPLGELDGRARGRPGPDPRVRAHRSRVNR